MPIPIATIIELALTYGPGAWAAVEKLIADLRASGATSATPEQLAQLQSDIDQMDALVKDIEGP